MANRHPDTDVPLVPSEAPSATDYERDFYSWALEQVRLMRESRWTALDRENLAEEIESLGREQFAKLRSALRVLMMHILKWDYPPERRSRSWTLSIEAQRVELEDVLDGNPGLKPRIIEAITKAYRGAVIEAMRETGLKRRHLPEQCP